MLDTLTSGPSGDPKFDLHSVRVNEETSVDDKLNAKCEPQEARKAVK